jgi:hypothetical protein
MAKKQIHIFRIIHRNNLNILLKSGEIVAPSFSSSNDYVPIGEVELIGLRKNKVIPVSPGGILKDYVAFYFGTRSPMLYAIWKGFQVERKPQEEIIYLVSTLDLLEENDLRYVFTDGHAFAEITQFYNDRNDLNQLDWTTIAALRWENNSQDNDRKRRKQAECLVYKSVPISAIKAIGVYNQSSHDYIATVFKENNYSIPIHIKPNFYY